MVGGDESWILTSTETVLRCYVEMLRTFYPLTKLMVPEVLAVFADCVCQHERETLVRPADIFLLLEMGRQIYIYRVSYYICIYTRVQYPVPF